MEFSYVRRIKKYAHFTIQFINFFIFQTIFYFQKKRNSFEKKYILVFRTDAIGDFFLSLDAIYSIAQRFDGKEMILIVNESIAPFIKSYDIFTKVIPFNREKFILNFAYHFKFIKSLRKYTFSHSFYLNFSREFLGDEITKLSRAENRIGWLGDKSRISEFLLKLGNGVYTQLIITHKKNEHELKRNNEFVNKAISSNESIISFNLHSNGKYRTIEEIFSKFNTNIENYCIIAPGSRIKEKIWSLDNFVEIINWLSIQYKLSIVLVGPQSESYIGDYLRQKNESGIILDLFGKINFQDIITLLRKSILLITNDNAISHLGCKLDCNMIGLLGGGQFGRFAPYGSQKQKWLYHEMECYNCEWVCKYKEFKCIQNISVKSVKDNIDTLINILT